KISRTMKENNNEILKIQEISLLLSTINNSLKKVSNKNNDLIIDLQTNNINPSKVLSNINITVGTRGRDIRDSSLGLNNLIYLSLLMMQLEDDTVPKVLSENKMDVIKELEDEECEVLDDCFEKSGDKYILKSDIQKEKYNELYKFFDINRDREASFTLLAIEEPEAHLHPSIQRTVYKEVMKENTSILISTHSPFITSIAPIDSIVHLIPSKESGTKGYSAANIQLTDRQKLDMQRYIDVKRGEMYFGRGIILVEGIAEEYLIPKFAELLEIQLDLEGIICCNINGTDFKPYLVFLRELGIPYVVITDGDYYYHEDEKKIFNEMHSKSNKGIGYDGNDRFVKINEELKIIDLDEIQTALESDDKWNELDKIFRVNHVHIGEYTLEVDMMNKIATHKESKEKLFNLFDLMTAGGDLHKNKFKSNFNTKRYNKCLNQIEGNTSKIGKGRFAQSLSNICDKNFIPLYIENALKDIRNQITSQKEVKL
ncbi:ATP-dependent endonuclease, partial [Rummeliibacillus sp. POC4]